MNLLIRFLLCTTLLFCTIFAAPAFADDPASSAEPAKTTSTADSNGSSTGSELKETLGRESPNAHESMLEDLKNPATRANTIGNIAELLGIASAIMLVTGSSLAFYQFKFRLFGLMFGVGVIGGVAGLAAPGFIIMSGSEALAIAILIFHLLLYFAVFFLPTILAFKYNTEKKQKIAIINFAGFLVPGAGLIALYVAIKDKPAAAAQTMIQ